MKTTSTRQDLIVDNKVIGFVNVSNDIALSATDQMVILRSNKMAAKDMVKTIESMIDIAEDFLKILEQACNNHDKYKSSQCTDKIKLPDYILEAAGIPQNAKLTAFAEEDSGIVRVEQADYDCDLTDVSEEMQQLFSSYGIRLNVLNALLMEGDIIYG